MIKKPNVEGKQRYCWLTYQAEIAALIGHKILRKLTVFLANTV